MVLNLHKNLTLESSLSQDDDEAYAEFLRSSLACLQACGLPRLQAARDKLFADCYSMPPYAWDYGLDYCRNFLKEGLPKSDIN